MGKGSGRAHFEINDGVRRSKAAELLGKQTIRAIVDGGASVQDVPVERLYVPKGNVQKHSIDISSERAEERWLDTFIRTRNGETAPPIDVRHVPNSTGVPIREVPIIKQGRPVDPFSGEEIP